MKDVNVKEMWNGLLGDEVFTSNFPDMCVLRCPPAAYFWKVFAVLRRADFGWLGLIGSATKRASFEHRLAERGIAPAAIARMVCPVGLPGIGGKQPGVIAVAIAAQLLTAATSAYATSVLS